MLTPLGSPPLLEARYELDEITARAAFRDLFANSPLYRKTRHHSALNSIIFAMTAAILFVVAPDQLAGILFCSMAGLIYLWTAWRLPYTAADLIVELASMDIVPGPRHIEVADGVITESAGHHYRAYRLAKVYNVRQTPEFLAVWMTQGELIAIPFGSRTFESFADELRQLIDSAKQTVAPVAPTV